MLPIQQGLTNVNYNSRGTSPKYIVLHYTANNRDTAKNNIDYFKSTNRGASANYFVDENSIWQCVRDTDTAWHVGNDVYYNAVRNNNSIGIEMCSYIRSGGTAGVLTDYRIEGETILNAIDLTKYLMKKYTIPASNVCRHYDVTRKICPAPMVYNNDVITWAQFLSRLQEDDMTQKEVETLITAATEPLKTRIDSLERRCDKLEKTYNSVADVPEWYREAVQYYINAGIIKGTGDGKLGLTETKCWTLTVLYRCETKYWPDADL